MNSTGAGNSAPKPEQQAMFTAYAPVPGSGEDMTDVHYGYGWFIARLHGHRIIYHPGDNAGFQAFNAWFQDDDAIVILLANDDHVKWHPTSRPCS
jgi:hypothetical protein